MNITGRVPSSVIIFKGRPTSTHTNTIYSKLINSPEEEKKTSIFDLGVTCAFN